MNRAVPGGESARPTCSHACTPQIPVLVLRPPQAAFHFPPALRGCLLALPNSVSVRVSHLNLNSIKRRALLILAALTETDKEHSLHQLCRQTLQQRNFGQSLLYTCWNCNSTAAGNSCYSGIIFLSRIRGCRQKKTNPDHNETHVGF